MISVLVVGCCDCSCLVACWPVIHYPTFVTRHTSHVTRHTSHVTRHTSLRDLHLRLCNWTQHLMVNPKLPKPQTPKPQTPNPKPQTPNPKPQLTCTRPTHCALGPRPPSPGMSRDHQPVTTMNNPKHTLTTSPGPHQHIHWHSIAHARDHHAVIRRHHDQSKSRAQAFNFKYARITLHRSPFPRSPRLSPSSLLLLLLLLPSALTLRSCLTLREQ